MELAQSQSVRAQADRLIRELQSSNRLLKSELQATTTTFKQALHAAQTMLDTAEEREQDIPGKLEQEDESEATDAMPGKRATGMPDLAASASKPTSSIGKAASNTQAGSRCPTSQGSFDSNSSDASVPKASSSKAGPLPSTSPSPAVAKLDFASQPQMTDLPKHGKPAAGNAAAGPPKALGAFPDSEAPVSPHQASPEGQTAGKRVLMCKAQVLQSWQQLK
ncbi:hypothetical protein WJX77_003299 [Trebouxia sp. C0004]